MSKHFAHRNGALLCTIFLKNLFFIALLLHLTGCGFQGRKYTTGHYWNGRNEIEYEKQSESEKQKEKQNENQNEKGNEQGKESAINQMIVSEDTISSKVDVLNSAIATIEEQKLIAPPSRSRTNHLLNNTRNQSLSKIETPVEIERDTVPTTLFNMHKIINRQMIWGCGFQGRKYTTGHYWNGRNEIEYEKQSVSEKQKQKENENEELKKNETDNEKQKEEQIVFESGLASEEKFPNNTQIKTQALLDTIAPEQNHSLESDKIPSEISDPIKLANQQIIPISIWSFLSFAMSALGAYLIMEEISIEAGLFLMVISIFLLGYYFIKISNWSKKAFEIRKDLNKFLSQNPKPNWAHRVRNKIFLLDMLELIGYFFQILSLLTIAGVIMTILYFAG